MLAGVLFENAEIKTYDLEIVRFGYHASYLRHFLGTGKPQCKVCDIPFKTYDESI